MSVLESFSKLLSVERGDTKSFRNCPYRYKKAIAAEKFHLQFQLHFF